MRILFIGLTTINEGPANVNRDLLNAWKLFDEIVVVEKLTKKNFFNVVKQLRGFDSVVVDGFYIEICLFQLFCDVNKVPFYCLMHGYLPFENHINNLGYSQSACNRYNNLLLKSAGIIVFSDRQKEFVAEHLSQVKNKIYVFRMGLNSLEKPVCKNSSCGIRISLSGGTRPIKRNKFVINAINQIQNVHGPITVFIYGDATSDRETWVDTTLRNGKIVFRGQLEHSLFCKELSQTDLFIMASLHESFGISAIDAVQAGVNILISEKCGVAEVFELLPGDVIYESDSEKDLAAKIEKVLQTPNNNRLRNSIDYKKYNWEHSVREFRKSISSDLLQANH